MMMLTPRLVMKAPVASEAETFAHWLNDPEVVKYSEQRHKTHTIESQLDYWHSPVTAHPNFVNMICLAGSEIPIGSISAAIDSHNQVANIGILIGHKSEWGKGYGAEAWECTMNYLFAHGIRKIEAGCMATNAAMIGLCHKVKMIREAVISSHFKDTEKTTAPLLIYGKLR